MTARPRVLTSVLADRLLAAAKVPDLAAAELQAASWPQASPYYEPVGCLLQATNHLRDAANVVDPVAMGFQRSWLVTSTVVTRGVMSIGSLVATVLAVLLSPASAAWYAVPAALAGWMAAFQLFVLGPLGLLARARLRATNRTPGGGSVAPLQNLADSLGVLLADIEPELDPRRRTAGDRIVSARQLLRQAIDTLPPEPTR